MRERGARLSHHVADAAQTEAAGEDQGFVGEPESREWQGAKGIGLAAGGENGALFLSVACECPGHAWRCRDGHARGEAKSAQTGEKLGEQLGFAAEQMRRAFDIEKQA